MTSNRTEASYIISLHQLINTNTSKFCSIASYIGPTLVVVDIQTLTVLLQAPVAKRIKKQEKPDVYKFSTPPPLLTHTLNFFLNRKHNQQTTDTKTKQKNNTKKLVIIHTMTFDRTKET